METLNVSGETGSCNLLSGTWYTVAEKSCKLSEGRHPSVHMETFEASCAWPSVREHYQLEGDGGRVVVGIRVAPAMSVKDYQFLRAYVQTQ